MKKLLAFLFIGVMTFNIQAQEKPKKEVVETNEFKIDSASVLTLDSTIKTLYAVISGEKGEERNWEQFKFLFKPDAKLIPSGKDKSGTYRVRYMTPDDYIKGSGKWLVENGFFEKEIHREIDTFGNITQVFSSYESFYSESDEKPFMRGINSIQLLNDGKRWWIINIYWTQESEENPIPQKYLP
ncbi:hypothetical protein [uncultured Algibacter sp.]|uniref:hypothetical protein n=1 Tax=uncultured Algibacter sp. TaxID=298659 RepID=UPI002617BE84|nr:hypothetical protein [uncultured Algibacter sp.]